MKTLFQAFASKRNVYRYTAARDAALRHPQTLAQRLSVLAQFRAATQIALLEENLYWLVHNGGALQVESS